MWSCSHLVVIFPICDCQMSYLAFSLPSPLPFPSLVWWEKIRVNESSDRRGEQKEPGKRKKFRCCCTLRRKRQTRLNETRISCATFLRICERDTDTSLEILGFPTLWSFSYFLFSLLWRKSASWITWRLNEAWAVPLSHKHIPHPLAYTQRLFRL